MMKKHQMLLKITLGSLLLWGGAGLHATNAVWTGATSNDPGVNTNWSGDIAPTSSTIAEFGNSGPSNLNADVNSGFSALGILFDAGAPSYFIDLEYSDADINFNIGTSGILNNSGLAQTIESDSTAGGSVIFAAVPGGVNSAGNNVNYILYTLGNGGNLTFQGATNGTGSFAVYGGEFFVGGNSSIGQLDSTGSIILNGSLTTTLTTGVNTQAAGNISGPGAFIVDGPADPGATTYISLSGTNTYTGGTIVNGGALIPHSPLPGAVAVNGGLLEIYYSSSSGSLSGTGGAVHWESSPTNFNVNQTINGTYAGILTGSVSGSTFTLGTTASTTATGILQLTGNSSGFTGNVVVDSGNLQVNGTLGANAITVNSGATLSGTGVFGTTGNTTTIASGGILSPGNSVGVVTNAGNHVFDAGSIIRVEENGLTGGPSAPSISLLIVDGSAVVDAAIVDLITTNSQINFNTKQVFLTAENGLTVNDGGFTVDTSGLPTSFNPQAYTVTASYDANNYYLLTQTQFANNGGDHNAVTIGKILDGIVDPNSEQTLLFNELAQLSTPRLNDALDDISGVQYTTELFVTEVSNRQFLRRLYDPLRGIVTTEPTGCCVPVSNTCCELFGCDVWTSGGGGQSQVNGRTGLKFSEWDVTLGLQKTFCRDWTFGIASSYEKSTFNYHGSNGSGKGHTWFGGLYGLYRPSCWYALADIAYSYRKDTVDRHLTFTSAVDHFKAKPQVSQATFYAEAGFDYNLCAFLVQPFIGIEVAGYDRKGFSETDVDLSGLSLVVNKQNRMAAVSSLGFHVTNQYCSGFNISVDLAWLYRFTNNKHLNASLASITPGTTFEVLGQNIGRSSGEGSLTISKDFCNDWKVFVEASGEVWSKASTYNVLAGLQVTW